LAAHIRKTLLQMETILVEGGKAAATPLRLFTAMAVVKNPWAGLGYVEDLKPAIHEVAPVLGETLTRMIIEAVGSGAAVEGYGKAAVVGLDGELEHASALIHTLRFGNHYREAVGATVYQPHTVRGALAAALKKRLGLTISSEEVARNGRSDGTARLVLQGRSGYWPGADFIVETSLITWSRL